MCTHRRGFTTAILHSDREAPIEHGALHKPLHLSVAYGYRDARELAAVFQGRRRATPTAARATRPPPRSRRRSTRWRTASPPSASRTGMAAIGAILLALLRAGDHVVSQRSSCSATPTACSTRWQAHGDRRDASSMRPTSRNVEAAITPQTRHRVRRDDRQSAHAGRRPGAHRRAVRARAASSTSSTTR